MAENRKTSLSIIANLMKGLGLLLFVLLMIVGSLALWQSNSLPVIDGRLNLADEDGLRDEVRVVRDRFAIPHIYAENEQDAWFALGFVHAQDRLWQMEMQRRTAKGRLAEVVGEEAFQIDVLLRSFDFPRYAKAAWPLLDKDTQDALTAYTHGVNSFITKRNHPLSVEFFLLQVDPEPWTVYDSLAVTKVIAMGLSGNAFSEAARAELATILNDEQIFQFFQSDDEDSAANPVRKWASLAQPQFAWINDTLNGFETGASNTWVVSGEKTGSGSPLLANDPHLNLTAPSIWYQAHLSFEGRNIIGSTIAGLPAVILGRNDNIAWGFTNTGPDTQDLFIEKINPDNPDEYLTPMGWRKFATREETFNIRFGDPVTVIMRETRHGPVIPQEADRFVDLAEEGHTIALAWTALSEEDITAQAFMHLNKAQGWVPFKRALRDFTSPMQSMVYADRRGNIGFIAPGRVPIRSSANETRGRSPVPGWDGRYDWQGFIPFEELPQAFNPEQHYLLSANNKIVPDDYPYMLTADWREGYRARRIKQLLEATPRHDQTSFLAMLRDDFSPVAARFLPIMMDFDPDDTETANAFHILRNWDHRMDAGSPAPLLYAAWYRELTRQIYQDETEDLFQSNWRMRPAFIWSVITDKGGQSIWCDDQTTLTRESCEDMFRRSLRIALDDLMATQGTDMESWQWGDAHVAIHKHQPFGSIPFLRTFFNIEDPTHGGATTLDRGRYNQASTRPFANVHAGGYRAIYDMGNPDKSLFMQSTGQSGNVLSKHYDDLAHLWAKREFIPQTTNREEIVDQAIGTLVLVPN